MVDHGHMLFSLLILLNVIFFFLGYIVGKLNNNTIIEYDDRSARPSKNKRKDTLTDKNSINIDETKFVTNINTTGMEKKYDSLGDKKTTNENIDNNINKLKTIKK